MLTNKLRLSVLGCKIAVCKLIESGELNFDLQKFIFQGLKESKTLFALVKTSDELSVICNQELVPPDLIAERDWRALKVKGPLDFELVGILASLTTALAKANISIFAISTFDTDYILVKDKKLQAAIEGLREFCIIEIEI